MIWQAKINLTEKKNLSYQLFCFHLNHKKTFHSYSVASLFCVNFDELNSLWPKSSSLVAERIPKLKQILSKCRCSLVNVKSNVFPCIVKAMMLFEIKACL